MLVRTSDHGTNKCIWVWLGRIPPFPSTFTVILDLVLWNRCTSMVDMFWIMITKTHNIAHFPRIFSKNVINLKKHPQRKRNLMQAPHSDINNMRDLDPINYYLKGEEYHIPGSWRSFGAHQLKRN